MERIGDPGESLRKCEDPGSDELVRHSYLSCCFCCIFAVMMRSVRVHPFRGKGNMFTSDVSVCRGLFLTVPDLEI